MTLIADSVFDICWNQLGLPVFADERLNYGLLLAILTSASLFTIFGETILILVFFWVIFKTFII